MTHTMRRGTPRRVTEGQLAFGLVPVPMSREGYCGRCNRASADIIRHRASQRHRDAMSSVQSSGPKGSSAYRARRARAYDPDDRYDPVPAARVLTSRDIEDMFR